MIAREQARLRALLLRTLQPLAVLSMGPFASACGSSDDAAAPNGMDASAPSDATIASHDASGEPSDACNDHLVILDAPGDGSGCDYFQTLGCGVSENVREGLDGSRSGCALYLGICYAWCGKYGSGVAGCGVVECDDAGEIADGPVTIDCVSGTPACTGTIGRRPHRLRAAAPRESRDAIGAWLASCARLEAASVRAFRELGAELLSLGAPRELVEHASQSARDEVRHARVVSRLARSRGAKPARALVSRSRRALRESSAASRADRILALARDNAIEGCVRETFGALVAMKQASSARDPAIASAMARIAEDETRHAALAWAIARWVDAELDDAGRDDVKRAIRGAASALRCEVRATDRAMAFELGLPAGVEGARLVSSLLDELLQPT